MTEGALFRFARVFGDSDGAVAVKAPGRVNLIGEHTDYNEGFVLPMAIDRSVVITGRRRPDRGLTLCSANYGEITKLNLDELEPGCCEGWPAYFAGVAWVMREAGLDVGGLDALIDGDVPQGAGLSSSAAFEVATGLLFSTVFNLGIDGVALARMAQKAENLFVGVSCGIMDQFASSLGRAGHALLIDCRSLDYEPVALPFAEYTIAVADTGVRRGLVDSEYNARRKECEEGVRILKTVMPGIEALRDVSAFDLAKNGHLLSPAVLDRCRHVVGENERVERAVAALRSGCAHEFGRLMNESHTSLRDLYKVSCRALDAMVESTLAVEGVLGSRMTGGGFGGCTVSLVRRDSAAEFATRVPEQYNRATEGVPHGEPRVFFFDAAGGAGLVS